MENFIKSQFWSNLVKRYTGVWVCLLLTASILVVYWPVQYFAFVDCDDTIYVTENRYVQRGMNLENVIWAFTTTDTANWHPLTWLSFMLDYELYRLNAGGYHVTNLILHTLNSLILFFFMRRITGEEGKSAFVAMVFAIHPLNVESVAWISERKNVLAGFFWILTMGAYVSYVEHPRLLRYLTTVLFFVLGLMAKPVLVTLPFVFLLMDFWPLRRFSSGAVIGNSGVSCSQCGQRNIQMLPLARLIGEKLPFFCIALLSSIVTIYAANRGNAIKSLEQFPWGGRIENVFISYAEYLVNMVLPRDLTVFYPYRSDVAALNFWCAVGLFSGVTFFALWMVRKRPYLSSGWIWYVVTMLPTIGVIQVGYQSMADRYAYLPLIGVFIMVAWGVPDILSRWHRRETILTYASLSIVVVLMIVSHSQVQHWRDSYSLFSHAMEVTEGNHVAHKGMGNIFLRQGDLEKASFHYLEALRLRPDYAGVRNNLGIVYIKQARYDDAVNQFRLAIEAKEDIPKVYNNMGIALALQGRVDDAVFQFRRALEIDPEYEAARYNLSVTLEKTGH